MSPRAMRAGRILLVVLLVLGAAYLAVVLAFGWMFDRAVSALSRDGGTILSGIDLSDGDHRLIIYKGEHDGPMPQGRVVRLIDDESLIERYRDAVDVNFSLSEFLPGEGRGDYYVYLYRGDERVAGRNVPSAFQIEAPDALLAAGKPMREHVEALPLAAFEKALADVRARPEAILRSAETPTTTDPDLQHVFEIRLPTVAAGAETGFDPQAYAEEIAARVRDGLAGGPFRISQLDARPLERLILDDRGVPMRDTDDRALELEGVELHTISMSVWGTPQTHARARALDLSAFVAEMRNEDLIAAGWMAATGIETAPDSIRLYEYDDEGSVGRAMERTYSLRYWEPAEDRAP